MTKPIIDDRTLEACRRGDPEAFRLLFPPKKIGPNLGKPPPERSGGLHNAPTVTLPACYFASTARRYLPSSAYFAYAFRLFRLCFDVKGSRAICRLCEKHPAWA